MHYGLSATLELRLQLARIQRPQLGIRFAEANEVQLVLLALAQALAGIVVRPQLALRYILQAQLRAAPCGQSTDIGGAELLPIALKCGFLCTD